MKTVEVDGLRIAYERAGDGPPLVLLHGYVGDGPTTALPATLTLASAYAGWAGSLPAEVAAQRLRQALALADLPPAEFVGTLLPTMFSEATPPESVDAFGAGMLGLHPVGFRAMARASAENLRPGRPARCRSCLQPRGPGGVQPDRPGVPPRP
jgi:hypothetical protein